MGSVDFLSQSDSIMCSSQEQVSLARRKRKSETPLIDNLGNSVNLTKVSFEANTHLAFSPPSKIFTMSDLGLPPDTGISKVAVSEPFPLFSEDAIKQMRAEILSTEVWEHCRYSSNLAQCQLRGFAPDFAPFVYDAWTSPDTLRIISKVAGVDLVPQMNFEIANVNISTQSEEQKQEALAAVAEKANREADEGVSGCPWENDKPIVDWHTDSYPFVCVTMMSDCKNMIGGETALRTGNGDVMKVRGPQMGCAVILQGRYIEHQALRAFGTTERITMVTSFRPKSAMTKDDTVLTTVRPISDLGELYFQYSEYRLEILEKRIRKILREMRDSKRAKRPFATGTMKSFLSEQEQFLSDMNREMVDEEKVIPGYCDESHLVSNDLRAQHRKKARVTPPEEVSSETYSGVEVAVEA